MSEIEKISDIYGTSSYELGQLAYDKLLVGTAKIQVQNLKKKPTKFPNCDYWCTQSSQGYRVRVPFLASTLARDRVSEEGQPCYDRGVQYNPGNLELTEIPAREEFLAKKLPKTSHYKFLHGKFYAF